MIGEKNIKNLALGIILFAPQLFFILIYLFNLEYYNSNSSNIYLIYNFIVFILSLFLYFVDLFNRRFLLIKNELAVFLFIIFLLLFFLIDFINGNVTNRALEVIQIFIVWSIQGSISGVLLIKYFMRYKSLIKKHLTIIAAFISVAAIKYIVEVLINNSRTLLGTANSQTAGYIFSLAASFSLFVIIIKTTQNDKKIILINSILLIFNAIGALISGTRGAATVIVLVFLYLYSITFIKRKIDIRNYIRNIIYFMLVIITVIILIEEVRIINTMFNRAFSFITINGLNWEASSGRDAIYINMINLIKNKPIFGYGIFGIYRYTHYPHNILLEIALQGGLVFMTLFLVYLFYTAINNIRYYKKKKNNKYIYILSNILLINVMTYLMFSGTYMNYLMFWTLLMFYSIYPYSKIMELIK